MNTKAIPDDVWTKIEKLRKENAKKMNFNLDDEKWWWSVFPICLDCSGFDNCPIPIEEKRKKPSCEVELYDKYHKEEQE